MKKYSPKLSKKQLCSGDPNSIPALGTRKLI